MAALQSHGLLDLPVGRANRCAPILLYLEILFAPIPVTVFRSIESRFQTRVQTNAEHPAGTVWGSEFSRDNRESETATTNFPNSSHHPLPFLSRSYPRHASPHLFHRLRVHFLQRVGPDTGPLGKGDPKFSAGRFRGDETEREDGGDKIPRTRVTASRKGCEGGGTSWSVDLSIWPLHAYDHRGYMQNRSPPGRDDETRARVNIHFNDR